MLAKHSKSFSLIDCISVGVDRMQRNFEPMQRQVEHWQQTQLTDAQAKLILYSAFVDAGLAAKRQATRGYPHHRFARNQIEPVQTLDSESRTQNLETLSCARCDDFGCVVSKPYPTGLRKGCP